MTADEIEGCRHLEAAFVAAAEAEGRADRERLVNPMSLPAVLRLKAAIEAKVAADEALCGVLMLIMARPDGHLAGIEFYRGSIAKADRARESAKGSERREVA